MALAIDSQMAGAAGASVITNTTLTFSFTNAAGTLIVVGVSWGLDTGALTITSVTYNGVSLGAAFVSVGYDGAGHNQSGAALYKLLVPATGANNVVVTASTSGPNSTILAGAMTFTGHDTTTPIVAGSGKTNFRESAGATATVTSGTTTVGNLAIAQMTTGAAYLSTTVGTLSWSKNDNTHSAGGNAAMTYASGTGSAITFSDTITSDFMGMVCCEVAAAGGGGATVTYPQLERGVRGLARGVAGGIARSFVRRDRIFVPAYAVLGDLQAAA